MEVDFERLSEELLLAGMHKVRVREMVKQIKQDMIDWPEIYESMDKCRWALERGFIPGRVKLYGDKFNESTYRNYYADYDYFMAHPLNNHFVIWINDKLTLKYMLNVEDKRKYLPEYYLYIENNGRYTYLMDAPSNINKGSDFIYDLLVEKKHLALKPNHGSGGMGFIGLEYKDGKIFMNSKEISKSLIDEIKPKLNGYVVTEFIRQSDEMNFVYSEADCALRIILYKKVSASKEAEYEYDCLMSYARFGADISEGASNLSKGGLAVRIDWQTGEFKGDFRGRAQFWGKEGIEGFKRHPDTGVVVDGKKVPHWEEIKNGLFDICDYMSSLDFFGMDVIITDDGFKICEINSAPSIGLGQFSYGKCCLDSEDARKFAESKKRKYSKTLIECFSEAVKW